MDALFSLCSFIHFQIPLGFGHLVDVLFVEIIINPLHLLGWLTLGFAVVLDDLNHFGMQHCLVGFLLSGNVVQHLGKAGICRFYLNGLLGVGFYVVDFF